MTAKEYLSGLEKLQVSLEQKKKDLKELQEAATAVGGFDYSKERVQTSASKDPPYAAKIEEAAELEKKILVDTVDYFVKKEQITDQIQTLGNADYISLLYKRYVEFKRLEQIAVEMNYSYIHVRRMHGWALQEFERTYLLKDDTQ